MSERDPFVGAIVGGRYEVLACIGRGAMGAIYEVRHTKLNRHFALKRLALHLVDDEQVLERFRQEADVVAALRHPNIVDIVDWDTLDDGTPCIVMELLRGENLEQRLGRVGYLAWTELFAIAEQIVSAIVVAHRAGVVHRDLKPQNIYLARDDTGDEEVKLLDFGISKVHGVSRTSIGALIGTPAYMAPEQADGRNTDVGPATDLWALGVILYELATGQQPFVGANTFAVLYQICQADYPPLASRRPDADPRFAALVDRLPQKSTAARLADADAVRRQLRAIAARAPLSRATPDASPVVPSPPPVVTSALSHSVGESVVSSVLPARRSWRWAALVLMPFAIAVWVILVRQPHQPVTATQRGSIDPLSRPSHVRPSEPSSLAPAQPVPIVAGVEPVSTPSDEMPSGAATRPRASGAGKRGHQKASRVGKPRSVVPPQTPTEVRPFAEP